MARVFSWKLPEGHFAYILSITGTTVVPGYNYISQQLGNEELISVAERANALSKEDYFTNFDLMKAEAIQICKNNGMTIKFDDPEKYYGINGSVILIDGNDGKNGAKGDTGPQGKPGLDGDSQFMCFIYKRTQSIDKPQKPNTGTYENPVPDGWSDGIPDGVGMLWMCWRLYKKAGETSFWSDPVRAADSDYVDFEWSSVKDNPGTPSTAPSNWHNIGTPDDIWMAQRHFSGNEWGEWQIFKIKGEQGEKGDTGDTGPQGPEGKPGKDGKDGTSINIVGELKTPDDLPCPEKEESFDHKLGDAYMINGDLWVYTGTEEVGEKYRCGWVNMGNIQGPASYIHIAWCNNLIGYVDFTTNPAAGDKYIYMGTYADAVKEDSEDPSLYTWTKVGGIDGSNGQDIFKSVVYCRYTNERTTGEYVPPLTPTGGSYSNPLPNASTPEWKDGIPKGSGVLWMSTRVFTSDGEEPQQLSWSDPVRAADSEETDYEWSSVEKNPGNPTDNPQNWHNEGTFEDIWMAQRHYKNGSWGNWQILKIKGEQGDGYYQHIAWCTDPKTGAGFTTIRPQPDELTNYYYGVCVSTEAKDPTDYTKYIWRKINGVDDMEGIENGFGGYIHIAWCNDLDSYSDFTTEKQVGQMYKYMGVCNDVNPIDPDDPKLYSWTEVKGDPGDPGQNSFRSIVYKRGTKPSKPTDGSYSNPVPSGWSDGIPDGEGELWMSSRIFTNDGKDPQEASWSDPVKAADSETIDFEYSSVKDNPGTPATSSGNWHNEGKSDDIWMAMRHYKDGKWGEWQVFKIKGEEGSPGAPGEDAVFYYIMTNADVVVKNLDGSFNPPTITCEKYKQVGSSQPEKDVTPEIVIKYLRNGEDLSENTYSEPIAITNKTISVKISLYNAEVLLDRKTIPVTTDISDLDYLYQTFNEVETVDGAVLGRMLGVMDENENVVAMINGSKIGEKLNSKGQKVKLMYASGISDLQEVKNATTRIYSDGEIITSDIKATGGVFNDVTVKGTMRSEFGKGTKESGNLSDLYDNITFSLLDGPTPETDPFNKIIQPSLVGGLPPVSTDLENFDLKWDKSQIGRRFTLCFHKTDSGYSRNYSVLYRPSGSQYNNMWFYIDGKKETSLNIYANDVIELLGYGLGEEFYGWILLNRADLGTGYSRYYEDGMMGGMRPLTRIVKQKKGQLSPTPQDHTIILHIFQNDTLDIVLENRPVGQTYEIWKNPELALNISLTEDASSTYALLDWAIGTEAPSYTIPSGQGGIIKIVYGEDTIFMTWLNITQIPMKL